MLSLVLAPRLDFALLRALGASRRQIAGLLLLRALLLGLLVAAVLLGIAELLN